MLGEEDIDRGIFPTGESWSAYELIEIGCVTEIGSSRVMSLFPKPMSNLSSILHSTLNRLSISRGPSSSSPEFIRPGRILDAFFGTVKTRLATPSVPGSTIYSGPLNGTLKRTLDNCRVLCASVILGRQRCWIRLSVRLEFWHSG